MSAPIVKAEMLIRKPVAVVFNAAKAWLEHGINLNIVADKAPDHNIEGWDQ